MCERFPRVTDSPSFSGLYACNGKGENIFQNLFLLAVSVVKVKNVLDEVQLSLILLLEGVFVFR